MTEFQAFKVIAGYILGVGGILLGVVFSLQVAAGKDPTVFAGRGVGGLSYTICFLASLAGLLLLCWINSKRNIYEAEAVRDLYFGYWQEDRSVRKSEEEYIRFFGTQKAVFEVLSSSAEKFIQSTTELPKLCENWTFQKGSTQDLAEFRKQFGRADNAVSEAFEQFDRAYHLAHERGFAVFAISEFLENRDRLDEFLAKRRHEHETGKFSVSEHP